MTTFPLPTAIQNSIINCESLRVVKVVSSGSARHGNFSRKLRLYHIQKLFMHGANKRLQDTDVGSKDLQKFKVYAVPGSSVDQVPSVHFANKEGGVKREHSYLFRTEVGGLVKVFVRDKGSTHLVDIEVSSLPCRSSEWDLELEWGMYRSDSSSLYSKDFRTSGSGSSWRSPRTGLGTVKVPFAKNALGAHTVDLEVHSSQVPFYLSFLLKSSSEGHGSNSKIRSHRKTNFCVPVGMFRGCPMPLGVSISEDGDMNFSLFSKNAKGVVLCLYDGNSNEPSLEIEVDAYINRTGDVWHISMPNTRAYVNYGYRCKGTPLWDDGSRFHMRHVLLDPYAKKIGKFSPDQGDFVSLTKCLGCIEKGPSFDWTGDIHPMLPMEKLVVYRLNVEQFTKDDSSGLSKAMAGTFLGISEKLHHFKVLGINAILLEPVFSFDEQKGQYLPYHFFSPMSKYGLENEVSADDSMKQMIKIMHAHGMEVLLEVVFTNTAEGGDADSQTISFRGIDNSSYYIVHGEMGSGTSNTLKCSNPVVQQLILDSLRHWVSEFHVDGFCFMNASSLTQGPNGDYLFRPPLVEAIAFDPILSKTKIIADCWSPLDVSYKDIHFPHWKRWAEVNTRFCDDIRNFMRGEGLVRDLATRLCGSGDIFSASRGPAYSFNYVTKNFGLSLVDLVSFSSDELASELSWNCGEEGASSDNLVLETRLRQIRNFLLVLFLSLGVPILNMGDELGHSTGGSPLYSSRQPIKWSKIKTGFANQIIQFISFLTSLRSRRSDIFQRREFLKVECIDWHANDQSEPKWEDPICKCLSVTLKAEKDMALSDSSGGNLFMAFNANNLSESVTLPALSEGYSWFHLVDTSMPYPGFFSGASDTKVLQATGLSDYKLMPHSCTLFEAEKSRSEA